MDENQCCVDCGKQWKDGISYFVLGFNFEDTFLSTEFLLAHMAHWEAKEEWFNQQGELDCNLKKYGMVHVSVNFHTFGIETKKHYFLVFAQSVAVFSQHN